MFGPATLAVAARGSFLPVFLRNHFMSYLPCVEIEPKAAADSAVIWLHGLGADGNDFVPLVPELTTRLKSTRFVFPHAPRIPVTVNGGYLMPAWYDILAMDFERKVDHLQLTASATAVVKLIERELTRGIESQNIILAGFSQGGAVAYQAALGYQQTLGGLIILSSYFASGDQAEFHPANRDLPILIQHGVHDPVVPEALGQRAYELLRTKSYPVEYQRYSMEHTLCPPQIEAIRKWLEVRLQ
jgi:phospholipase/carboxylesterase